jgi:hypothetical protein
MNSGLESLTAALRVAAILSAAQVRMFINQVVRSREPARLILLLVGAVFVLFLWIQELVGTLLVAEGARQFPSRFAYLGGSEVLQVLGLGLVAYAVLLVFSSALFSLNALLLNPDLDLLLVVPWRVDTILGARMLNQVFRMVLLSFVLVLPLLVGLGMVLRQPLVPLALIAILTLYPVMFVIGASVFVLLIVRFIPPSRAREAMAALGIAFAAIINLANFTLNPALASRSRLGIPNVGLGTSVWSPIGWASRAMTGVLTGDPLAVLGWGSALLATTVLVFLVGTRVSGALYLSGWAQGAWGTPRRSKAAPAIMSPGRSARRRSPVLALVLKDIRVRRRDLAQLAGLVMPLGFFSLVLVANGPRLLRSIEPLGPGPLLALTGITPVLFVLLSLTTALGLSAVSLEGRGIWIYAASPNSMRGLLEAKCWTAAVPTMAVSLILGTVIEIVIRAGLAWSAGAVALLIVVSGALACVMVGLGGLVGRFDWTDARRMIHPVGGLLALVVQFGLIAAVTGLVLVPLLVATIFHQSLFGLFLVGLLCASLTAVLAATLTLVLAEQRLRRLEV